MRASASRERLGRLASMQELLDRVMPEQSERMGKLAEVLRAWGSVVPPAVARHSSPYDLVGTTLCISARLPQVKDQLLKMRGNILRALEERWALEVTEVKVTLGDPPAKISASAQGPRRRHPRVEPDEAQVQAFREMCPDSLAPEASEALARLRAFFARRFSQRAVSPGGKG
ncbi:MAG: DUF721 domain-containing protein [Fretibacterium sp.]|nr:DUF721 domain-containing protein [Fretibacterium sp.]